MRSSVLRVVLILWASAAFSLCFAQTYPSKTITIIPIVPPGGPIDWFSRTVGAKLQERWGQPVVVDNRPGAGGWLATQAVQRAAPDAHTLLAYSQAAYDMGLFIKGASFDPGVDIQPVTPVFAAPYVLAVNTSIPATNARELVAYAKANPGKLNMGAFPLSDHWLQTYWFVKQNGLDVVIVPYKGGAELQQSLLTNDSQAIFINWQNLDPIIKAGKARALAVTSAKRFLLTPDLPTVKEAAGVDMDAAIQYGFFTTIGSPVANVDKLAGEIANIVTTPDMRAQIEKLGYEPLVMTPAEWTKSMRAELASARATVKAAGISPQ
jgi:tripartite-type tricarboxylate transporter receptor subunit TctC